MSVSPIIRWGDDSQILKRGRAGVMDIKKLVSEMTLEEKAGLCSGSDFWHTKAIELTQYILTELPKHCDEKGNIEPADLDYLMPWSDQLPEECKKPRRS